ncbi:LysR substrate-binding domain-containing protein [Ancylobacter sp.]|uniref:LysR substrate-binding domain-containing protein n=1 Tax=Ancylobacter sp. TaxID=1872567 RepID=UPI003D0D81CE
MRYVQLRAFHHVAISGSFTRAAAELFLTQPAISDQVRKLEAEYDVLLFNRAHRQITLTAAGENLLAVTRRLFDAEEQALELLSESRALRAGTLRIVADAAHHIVDILRAFRETYPGVTVAVRAGNTETVVESLVNYEADIGVLGDVNPSREFDIIRLNATPVTAFVSRDHPLAGTAALSLAELARHPLVGREIGSKTRRRLEESAAKAGVELTFAIEAEGREAVREIVAAGLGIGFVSEAEFGLDPRLVAIPLAGEPVLMEEALICLSERTQAKTIRAFLDLARDMRS